MQLPAHVRQAASGLPGKEALKARLHHSCHDKISLQFHQGCASLQCGAVGHADSSTTSFQQAGTGSNTQQEHVNEKPEKTFNWHKQWYPLAAVQDYDTTRPHAEMLLGQKLVLWHDGQKIWRCFEDECPHRLVPLSEGRIDPSSGNLMCGYHGWTFSGDGKPADIPQLRHMGERANKAVASNGKSSARTRPVQVKQGLIFVWGEGGPHALEESKQTAPSLNTFREDIGEDNVAPFLDQYVRDLPANFEVWTENMQDQSHVTFAHHGVVGKRGGEKEGFFEMTEVEKAPTNPKEKGAVYKLRFKWTSNGKNISDTELYFKPPCLSSFLTMDRPSSLYIYAVPTSASATRLIINACTTRESVSKSPISTIRRLFPNYYRMIGHLSLNKVNQGDIIFMTGQQRALGRSHTQPGHTEKYFFASDADRGTAAWNTWLNKEGGKGPKFSNPDFTEKLWWTGSGQLKREHVLDNFSQHTCKCSSCQKVLGDVEKGQRWTKWLGVTAFLGVAGLLGQGQQLWSLPCLLTLATMGASSMANTQLAEFHKRFHYEPWSQADLD